MPLIRKGDGTTVAPKGIAEVRKGDGTVIYSSEPAIPDSGDHQWYIDEGSGTTLNDSVGSVSATINGATWQSESGPVGGQYLSLDGIDDNWITDSSVDANQTAFTFFGWARFDNFVEFNERFAGGGERGDAEGEEGWYISSDANDGELLVVCGKSSTVRNTPFASAGDWGFIGLILDGDSTRLITYDNSQELADVSGSGGRTPTSGDLLYLGSGGAGAGAFGGDCDFVGWADSKLTKTELTDLWEATKR